MIPLRSSEITHTFRSSLQEDTSFPFHFSCTIEGASLHASPFAGSPTTGPGLQSVTVGGRGSNSLCYFAFFEQYQDIGTSDDSIVVNGASRASPGTTQAHQFDVSTRSQPIIEPGCVFCCSSSPTIGPPSASNVLNLLAVYPLASSPTLMAGVDYRTILNGRYRELSALAD